jgi:hypothetical protein
MKLLYLLWRYLNILLCGHPVDAREPLTTIRVYGARIVEYRCRHCCGTYAEYIDLPRGLL